MIDIFEPVNPINYFNFLKVINVSSIEFIDPSKKVQSYSSIIIPYIEEKFVSAPE